MGEERDHFSQIMYLIAKYVFNSKSFCWNGLLDGATLDVLMPPW